jgi:hypothetical protein
VTPVARAHRPAALWPLIGLLGLLSVSSLYGGLSFVTDRTGAGLQARLSWLADTPVTDFLLPGLFLLGVFGIGGALLIVGLIWRPSPGPLRRLDAAWGHHWSWIGTIGLGVVLVLWIVYELLVMPEQIWLQPVLIVIGLSIAWIPFVRSMRRWYRTDRNG